MSTSYSCREGNIQQNNSHNKINVLATLPQGKHAFSGQGQRWKTPGELGVSKFMKCHISPSVLWHCWLGDRKGIHPVRSLFVGLLVVTIWLELCTSYSSSCHHPCSHTVDRQSMGRLYIGFPAPPCVARTLEKLSFREFFFHLQRHRRRPRFGGLFPPAGTLEKPAFWGIYPSHRDTAETLVSTSLSL